MKTTLLVLVAAGAGLLAGCVRENSRAPVPEARTGGPTVPGIGYDDRQIAKIQRGTTAEAQLLEWFGLPESREMRPDGRSQLSWSFLHRTDGGPGGSGALMVSLASDGTVESYAARGGPPGGKRTVESVDTASGYAYDDRRVAQIRRGQTTGVQLVEWFGPAQSRVAAPDGRAQLTWNFARRSDGGPGHSGELRASLTPDNTVDSYSAHRGPE